MLAIKQVLAPVDFSEMSEAMAAKASRLAAIFGAELTILHVGPSFQAGDRYLSRQQLEEGEKTQLESSRQLEDRLKALAHKVAPAARPVLVEGDPATAIEDYVKSHAVDLVALATHGLGRFRRYLLGSLTSKLLHVIDAPIVTGTHRTDQGVATTNVSNVGCALGLRDMEDCERITRWAGEFAKLSGARLTILHVLPIADPSFTPAVETLKAQEDRARQEIIRLLERAGLTADIVVDSGEPMAALVRQLDAKGCDALVIGRTPKKGAFLVGHADGYALIRQSPVPVFSV